MATQTQERERERGCLYLLCTYAQEKLIQLVLFFLVCLITMEALINSGLCKGSLCRQEDIEQLSMDGSHYSFSTGILPSLGGSSARRIKLKRFIISPYDRRYRCKSDLILGFSLWACDFLFPLHSYVSLSLSLSLYIYIYIYKRLVIYCFYWFDFFCIIYMNDFYWFNLSGLCWIVEIWVYLPYCSCSF